LSLDITKTDSKLGEEIHYYLEEKSVETPMQESALLKPITDFERNKIQNNFKDILITLGLDLTDDSLAQTPSRMGKMFLNELFWGLDYHNFPKCTTVENKMGYDEMVIERNIKVNSVCEHHLVTIYGNGANIAYIPDKKVLGLSKLNRIVEYFCRRPQIQERLTEQIFYALEYILGTSNIAIVIEAEHFCVKSRGVEDVNSDTVTSKLGGLFKKESALRAEFMGLIKSTT